MAAKRPASPTHVECQKHLVFFWIWCPLSWTPFFVKGPPKITELGRIHQQNCNAYPGREPPYGSHVGMCRPKGYVFCTVLV